MQNAKVWFRILQQLVAQCVYISHLLIFKEVGEAFLLHTSHVKDISISYVCFVQFSMFFKWNVVFLAEQFVFLWQFQLLRSDKRKSRIEMRHCLYQ